MDISIFNGHLSSPEQIDLKIFLFVFHILNLGLDLPPKFPSFQQIPRTSYRIIYH